MLRTIYDIMIARNHRTYTLVILWRLVISLANITVSSRRSAILAYSLSAFSLINMFLSLQRRTYTFIAFARECVVWRVREGRVELRRILNRI